MYAKIFTQILDSSLAEDYQTRHVFEDLLKLCDVNGVVDVTHEAIARRTNAPLEVIRAAISRLEQPDPASRNPDNGGRRIVRLDEHRTWGWLICNYAHYRAIASDEQRREKTRLRVEKHRNKAPKEAGVQDGNAPVTLANASNAMQREMQKEKKKEKKVASLPALGLEIPATLQGDDFAQAWADWCDDRRERKKPITKRAGEGLQLKDLSAMGKAKAIAAIRASIKGGWQGLFEPKASTARAGSSIAPGHSNDHRGGAL